MFTNTIALIYKTFPASELRAWANLPLQKAASQAHHELGLWIRNQAIYSKSCPPAVAEELAAFGSHHADSVSAAVIQVLWHHLNNLPLPDVSNCFVFYFPTPKLDWSDAVD